MSMDLMVKAMKLRIGNPVRKLVLIKLADHANDKGECWPSYQYIADQCEIDRSTVRRHIKQLVDDGLLILENRKGPKGNTSNMYRLLLNPIGSKSTPPVGTKSIGVGTLPPPPVGTESTRTSHSLESVSESKPLRGKSITLGEHIELAKAKGVKSIPENHRVFSYAEEVGLPLDYLRLAWRKFVDYYKDGPGSKKKYIDWPATFCNNVKNNYNKLWWISDNGEFNLTTAGKQAEKEFANHE